MATPLDIANELNKMILQQNQNLLKQAAVQRNQLSIMIKMAEVMEAMNPGTLSDDFAKINEELQKIDENLEALGNSSQENMSRAAAAASKASEEQKKLADGTERYNKILKRLGQGLIVGASFFGGMGQAIQLVKSVASGLFDVLGSVTSTLFNLGAAIISAPFKMLGSLLESASQGGGSELRQALEDIRKEFGDLSTGSSKAIISMSKSMKGELANTGLSTYRIFGTLAERLKTIAEYAKQLGPLFTNLAGDMVKNAEAVGAYVKGLGLTEEGMRGIGATALASGKSFTEVGREVTSFAFQMGDAFGINGKEISRDVATMMKDVKNFGNLSVKQLTQVTVYARKLGLEFKDMQGVIDKFDNFEDAAQGAAQLSQAFGMNVNALELVQEQDPAARFDKLRKAFYSTGKSVESMTRQELKLLTAQTGLSEEAVKLGFSQANQGLGYDEVQKKAGLAEKKQLTQAQAMEKLANSIERMVKSGGTQTKSFFDIFVKGFESGVMRSAEFRGMMRALAQSLRIVFRAGREVGRAFVDAFPGVKQFFGGMRDLFNPDRIKKLMSNVVVTFKKFFKDVSEGKGTGFTDLMKNLKKNFFDFFNVSKGPGTKILDAVKSFAKGIVTILAGLAKEAMSALTDVFKMIASFIKDPSKALNAASSAGGGVMSSIMQLLQPLFEAVAEAWPALKDSFVELLGALWEKIKPTLVDLGMKIAKFIFLYGLAKAGMSLVGIAATEVAKEFAKDFATNLKSNLGAGQSVGQAIMNSFKLAPKATGDAAKAAADAAATANNASGLASATAGAAVPKPKSNVSTWKEIAKLALGIAAAAVILAATYALIEFGLKAAGVDTSLGRVMEVGAVLGTMALTFIAIGVPLAIMAKQKFSGRDLVKAGIAFVAIGAASVLLALTYMLIDKILPNTDEKRVEMVGDILWIMTKTFGLVGLGLVAMAFEAPAVIGGAEFAALAFVAIGAAVALMAAEYLGLEKMLGDVKTEKVETVEKVMGLMMGMFLKVGLLLAGSAVLGGMALIFGPLMIEGVRLVTNAVDKMVESAVEIMKKVEAVNVTSGFSEKIDSFINIMEVLVKMADILSKLLANAKPSVWSIVFRPEKTDTISETFQSLGQFVASMTTNVDMFIESIVTLLQAVPESSLATFDRFGKVITGIISLISALAPNFGDFKVDEGDVADFGNAMTATTKFFKSNLKAIEDFLPTVITLITSLSGQRIDQSAAATLNAAFSGIGSILSTVPSVLSAIGTATKKTSGEDSKADAQAFKVYADKLPSIFDAISTGLAKIGPSLETVIKAVVGTVKDLTEPQMKRAEVAFKNVGTLLYYSKEFIEIGLKAASQGLNYSPTDASGFNSMTSVLSEIFGSISEGIKSLGEVFPVLVKAVNKAFANIGLREANAIRDRIKVFFEIISTAANMANTLRDMAPALSMLNTAGPAAADQMVSGGPTAGSIITSVSDFLLQISTPINTLVSTIKTSFTKLSEEEFKRVKYGFTQLFGLLHYVNEFSKKSEGEITTEVIAEQLATNSKNVLEGMVKAAKNIKDMVPQIIEATNGIDFDSLNSSVAQLEGAITDQTGKSIKAVVDRLNRINSDLMSIAEAPTSLNVQLQRAADNLSLRGNGALTINKPDFTVNINVEVKLHADEFESTLISRPGKSKFVVKGA